MGDAYATAMSASESLPDWGMPIDHVIDRHGYVWRVVHDGGMATRAHYAGIISIGIAALEREHGPLVTLAAHDAEVAERALREAADAWTQGQWSDVMLPKPTPPAVPVIAYANRIGDWLRARADRVAGHAQEDDRG
jgi:hypothetical protein